MINVRRLSPRERRAAILTAAVLLGGLLWVKVLEPTVNRWLQLRREIVASEKELMKMQELLVQKDAVEAAMRRLGPGPSSSDTSADDPDALLKAIEAMSSASGLRLLYLKPQQLRGRDISERLSAELKVEGSMRSLGQLLQEIETSMLLLRTQQLTVTAGREAGQIQAVVRIGRLSTRGV